MRLVDVDNIALDAASSGALLEPLKLFALVVEFGRVMGREPDKCEDDIGGAFRLGSRQGRITVVVDQPSKSAKPTTSSLDGVETRGLSRP